MSRSSETTAFFDTMDPRAQEIFLDGKRLGSLHWHTGTFELVLPPSEVSTHIPLSVLDDVLKRRDGIQGITPKQRSVETSGIEFRLTMDSQAQDVYLDGKPMGSLQWHKGFKLVLPSHEGFSSIPLSALAGILRRRDEIVKPRRPR